MQNKLEELSVTPRPASRAVAALALIALLSLSGATPAVAGGEPLAPDPAGVTPFQRCGDHVFFSFADQDGQDIELAKFESVAVYATDQTAPFYPDKFYKGQGLTSFAVQSLCGRPQLRVKLAYRGKTMEILLKGVPGDQGNIALHSVPFSEGAYEFDFERHLSKSCGEDFQAYRRYHCTLSPKRLKKIASDADKHERAAAVAGAAQRGGRIRPPDGLRCDPNRLTSFTGRVTYYRRGATSLLLRMRTDEETDERFTLRHGAREGAGKHFLIEGEPFKPSDWSRVERGRGRLRPGMRATVWACEDNSTPPVVDWRPGGKSPGTVY